MSFFKGYLGLLTTSPVRIAPELSAGGYSRQKIAYTASGDGRRVLPVSPSCSFGYATENWGTVTGVALFADAIADTQPLIAWSMTPRTVTPGQTYTLSSSVLSLVFRSDRFFAPGDILGISGNDTEIVARQPVSIADGVLAPGLSATGAASGTSGLTLSALQQALSELMQTLPTSDPGDGTSLWSNANLLALSSKS